MTERSTARPQSDLATRAVAGAVMISAALLALWAGGVLFWLLVSAAALLMMMEWSALVRARRGPMTAAVLVLGLLLGLSELQTQASWDVVSGLVPPEHYLVEAGVVATAAAALAGATRQPLLGAGLLYAGLPALALLILRHQPSGMLLTLWTLAVVWSTDIGAYFAGRAIGGPKLAPAISPAKTWSGLGGGIAAALLVGAAIASAATLPRLLLVLGAPLAVLAQAGDLFESWLKRRAGVKDSGKLLPGHGGVLDRLDGLVPVAVAVALLLVLGRL